MLRVAKAKALITTDHRCKDCYGYWSRRMRGRSCRCMRYAILMTSNETRVIRSKVVHSVRRKSTVVKDHNSKS